MPERIFRAAIKSGAILPDYSAVRIKATEPDGRPFEVEFKHGDLMGLMQMLALFFMSINKKLFGGPAFVETEDAQIHSLGQRVGLEVAFGNQGTLNFDISLSTAQKLHEQLADEIARLRPPSQKPLN